MIYPLNKDVFSLQKKCAAATAEDQMTALSLMETLMHYQDTCIGMAANMIGIHKKIIAVNVNGIRLCMLNPVITQKDHPYQTKEGCLCLLGQRDCTRYENITVSYQDFNMKQQKMHATGLLAQAIQHEIDHCNGILI